MQDADGVAGERCRPVEDLVDLPDQRLIRLVRRVVQGVGQHSSRQVATELLQRPNGVIQVPRSDSPSHSESARRGGTSEPPAFRSSQRV